MNSTVFQPMDMTAAEALLKEAKQILDQLGLAFFLRHGTCLGAVRDKRLIEWDDDLDIGSVIGMHDLTESKVRHAATVFDQHGFHVDVIDSELHLSVDLKKNGIQLDWTCYRIIDDSIYQWPVIKIPTSLYTPKKAGVFEQEVLDLMEESGTSDGSMRLADELLSPAQTGSLKVIDTEGHPVQGADIALAATTVLTGLEKAATNNEGVVYFTLPEKACYVVAVKIGDQSEILYLEELSPGVSYT